ncbi:Gfo/Idh/MocA family oxidoreductase [Georgenia daeguensis]|uniref:Gfo/Idh/MocA family protein n=1 Tax=Georgenia daeguensis TaxID=908355 RepID=UPI0031EB9160
MDQRIGVGIIGLGTIGVAHARVLHELGDRVRLVAHSGGSPAAAAEAGWPDAVKVGHDDVATHPGVQIVVVCSPSAMHAAQTLAALDAGRHAVVEKPLSLTVGEADRITALAAERGLTVAMISQRRFEPENLYLKARLDAGDLGELRLARTHVHWWRDDAYYAAAPWRTTADGGGGSLLNQGMHYVDILRWLCGEVVAVTAQQATLAHPIDTEDTTVATVRFASGALGLISTSTATYPGSPATLALDLSRGGIEVAQGRVLRWDVDGVPAPDVGAAPAGDVTGASDPRGIGIGGHLAQWRDVLDAVAQGRPPAVDAADAARTIRLLSAIGEAAATGRTVDPAALS